MPKSKKTKHSRIPNQKYFVQPLDYIRVDPNMSDREIQAELDNNAPGRFDRYLGTGESSGGMTGSTRIKYINHDGTWQYIQLKLPIKYQSKLRQKIANYTDNENLEEYIGAHLMKEFLNQPGQPLRIPDVQINYSNELGGIVVASPYLEVVDTLQGYADKKVGQRGAKISATDPRLSPPKTGEFNIGSDTPENKRLRQGIADIFAGSILVDNADPNPGNLVILKNGTVGGIDYGHALGNMVSQSKFSRLFGGGISNKDNNVLDYLNREALKPTVGIGPSKIWKNYTGFIPSEELANSMLNMVEDKVAYENKLRSGLVASKRKLDNMFTMFLQNKPPRIEQADDLAKSLIKINKHITRGGDTALTQIINSKPKRSKKVQNYYKQLDKYYKNLAKGDTTTPIQSVAVQKYHQALEEYYSRVVNNVYNNIEVAQMKRREDMIEAAKIMQIQNQINKTLFKEKLGEINSLQANIELEELKTRYLQEKDIKKNIQGEITWIKDKKNKKAFKGGADDYIDAKRKYFNNQKINKDLSKSQSQSRIRQEFNKLTEFPSKLRRKINTYMLTQAMKHGQNQQSKFVKPKLAKKPKLATIIEQDERIPPTVPAKTPKVREFMANYRNQQQLRAKNTPTLSASKPKSVAEIIKMFEQMATTKTNKPKQPSDTNSRVVKKTNRDFH